MDATRHDSRRADLAKIHIAKKDLGLDDEVYRDILWTVARVRSAGDLDDAGRRAVLEHFRARGWKPAPAGRKSFPGRPHNVDSNPQLKKVEALLADGRRPWSYADAMVRRMFHVERVAWCNAEQLQKLIAALVVDQKRHASKANERSR